MIEIEKYPCDDRCEADKREYEHKKDFNSNIDTYKSSLSEEDRKEHNRKYREENDEKNKEFYNKNKEKIKENRRLHYETNKEKVKERCKNTEN